LRSTKFKNNFELTGNIGYNWHIRFLGRGDGSLRGSFRDRRPATSPEEQHHHQRAHRRDRVHHVSAPLAGSRLTAPASPAIPASALRAPRHAAGRPASLSAGAAATPPQGPPSPSPFTCALFALISNPEACSPR